MTILVEPDRTIADLRSDSIFWIEEVAGLHPMPAENWPEETRAKVESYVNAHFRLSAGKNILNGKLVRARYRQLPWEVNEEGVFFLRLEYPAVPAETALTGSAAFYEEYRSEMAAEYRGRTLPYTSDYRTFVDIPGRRRLSFTLTADAPAFTAAAVEARRTPFAMTLESLRRGAETTLGTASGFPTVLAIALCLGARPPGRRALGLLLGAVSCGFAAGGLLPAPAWLAWAGTLGATLAAGLGRLAPAASAAAAGCLGLAWCAAARPALPHAPLALPAAFAGASSAGAALLFVAWCGLRAEQRRLADVSESRAEELFARRVRLTATALAMVGAYGLWQSFQR
ncbi:MAG: hypothetical protein HYV14_10980 [Elusimicrobia bacterium]|nr:hypothetical protein [Elusimicrobiota bacterium]